MRVSTLSFIFIYIWRAHAPTILSFILPLQTRDCQFILKSTDVVGDLINNIKVEDENIRKIEILLEGQTRNTRIALGSPAIASLLQKGIRINIDGSVFRFENETETVFESHGDRTLEEKIVSLENDFRKFKIESLKYRLVADILYIGEAASELLETNRKPKSCSSPLMENNITWNRSPNKPEMKPLNAEGRADLEIVEEGKNILSHIMKRKRSQPEFLETLIEDFKKTKKTYLEYESTDELEKIIPQPITEVLDSSEKTNFF